MAMSKALIDSLLERIDGYRDEMVEFQKELTCKIALGPENEGRGEWERANFLIKKLKEFGLEDITEYNAKDERVEEGTRPNLTVRLKGTSSNPTIWIMAHMDVVPAGDLKQWLSNPFEPIVKEGKIFGRGVEDNQQGLVSALFAMRAIKEHGIQPASDIALLLVSDEETGNKYGIYHVLQEAPDLIKPTDLVIVPDSGSETGAMIEVAEKSILWCKFEVIGKQVHASLPHKGNNAHRAACHLAVKLDNKLLMTYAYKDEIFDPPESTFELTKRDANVPNVNTIPGVDTFWLDCRILPEYDLEDVKTSIEAIVTSIENEFKLEIKVDYPQSVQAATPTPEDAPVVNRLSEAIRYVIDIEPEVMGIGGGTVAATFRSHGTPAAVWSTVDEVCHEPNEYCIIDNLVQDTKVFAYLFAADNVEESD